MNWRGGSILTSLLNIKREEIMCISMERLFQKLDKKREWEMMCRVKPDVTKGKEMERSLQRIATRRKTSSKVDGLSYCGNGCTFGRAEVPG
ncbi:RRP15-like protein isoform 1-T1 [Liasis olivaceus]